MIPQSTDLKSLIDSLTALVVAFGVLYTAYKANKVHETAKTIEKSVNGAATKAQDVINTLREQLVREKEISQEKTQTAAVLQASGGSGQHNIPQQQQKPVETVIVNEEPVSVKIDKK